MRNPITKFLKQYFYFNKRDRNAINILIVIIISGIVINEIIKHLPSKSDYNYYEFAEELERWENSQNLNELKSKSLFQFNPNTITEQKLDSLLLPSFVIRNLINYRKAGGVFDKATDLKKIYGMNDSIFGTIEKYIEIPEANNLYQEENSLSKSFPEGTFDPNLADKSVLLYFGFNIFQAENLINYRENGGKIKSPSEILKIYGIDSLFYERIKNNIIISETVDNKKQEPDYEPNFTVELNSADSVQLVQLNGIGPVFASRIIKYRDLLGGFYSTSQLLEVYNFPEETYINIKNYLKVDTSLIRQIRINFAQYGELIRHPYLNNEPVNSILKYKEQNGPINSASEFNSISGMDSSSINKITPYISFR